MYLSSLTILQCREAARRATTVLSQISRVFMYRDKRTFLQLYKQFVRCHLEFAVQAWSPWLIGDIELLEGVQRRAVNMSAGLQGLSYEEKLRELNLCTLVERRKKFDMVQVFKILGGIDNVDFSSWFTLVNLIPSRNNTDIRRNFFSNRVVSTWN